MVDTKPEASSDLPDLVFNIDKLTGILANSGRRFLLGRRQVSVICKPGFREPLVVWEMIDLLYLFYSNVICECNSVSSVTRILF